MRRPGAGDPRSSVQQTLSVEVKECLQANGMFLLLAALSRVLERSIVPTPQDPVTLRAGASDTQTPVSHMKPSLARSAEEVISRHLCIDAVDAHARSLKSMEENPVKRTTSCANPRSVRK